jgi:hypothetical protein
MISAVRDQAMALAAARHGLPTREGRGFDGLPQEVRSSFEGAVVRSIDTHELKRAFRVAAKCLLIEIKHANPALAIALAGPLNELSA